jgi:hypothetical protein
MKNLFSLTAIAGLVLSAGFVLGGDLPMEEHVDGYPKDFHKGDVHCYGVWHHKDGGWHVAITTAGARHHFKGRIWIEGDGKFGEAKIWKGNGEYKAEEKEANWFHKELKRKDGDKELFFDFVSESKHVSGLFFEVEGKGPIKWELGIGGPSDKEKVEHNAEWIKLGSEGKHPEAVPFQTWAHPDEKKHGK